MSAQPNSGGGPAPEEQASLRPSVDDDAPTLRSRRQSHSNLKSGGGGTARNTFAIVNRFACRRSGNAHIVLTATVTRIAMVISQALIAYVLSRITIWAWGHPTSTVLGVRTIHRTIIAAGRSTSARLTRLTCQITFQFLNRQFEFEQLITFFLHQSL